MFPSVYPAAAVPGLTEQFPPVPVVSNCCDDSARCWTYPCDNFFFGNCGRLRGVCRYRGACCGFIVGALFFVAVLSVPTGLGFFAALGYDQREWRRDVRVHFFLRRHRWLRRAARTPRSST